MSTRLSLKFRRNCTAHETSEPKVAVAITHGLVLVVVGVDTTVVVNGDVVTDVAMDVVVCVGVVVAVV